MSGRLVLSAVCALICLPAAAAEKSSWFQFVKPLASRNKAEEEILAFNLDSDIYAATRLGFPDLRIFDDRGAESPFQIERDTSVKTERVRTGITSEVVSLKEGRDRIEVHIRLNADVPPADGLTFAIPLKDYERKVDVDGSVDGQQWTELVKDGLLFDYSRYMDVRNRDVRVPENKFRHLRVVLEDVVQEKESPFLELTRTLQGDEEKQRVERTTIERRPLRIDRIELWRETAKEQGRTTKTIEYSPTGFQVSRDEKAKQTVVEVTTRREPLTSLTLKTSQRNFARHASVEIPIREGRETRWTSVGNATIMKFTFRSFHKENTEVSFPEQRQDKYRLVIQDEDNPPLPIDGVRATGNVHRAVFLAEPDRTYNVYYGAEGVDVPRYEASTVLTALRRNFRPQIAELGKQETNRDFRSKPDGSLLAVLNRPVVLVAAICCMVLVLGWALFQASLRMGPAIDGDTDSEKRGPT